MAQTTAQDRNSGELVDKLVGIRRVAKTVKGGRRMAMSALVIVGDESGRVGWGKGKAKEVPDAVRKATDSAKKSMVRVPMRHGRTLHHEMEGCFGSARVIIKPAVPGTGIIAGGPMRAVFEAMGIKDVVAKSLGSNNPYNMIQATFAAFGEMYTPRNVAAKRGIKVSDLELHKEEASRGDVDAKEEAIKEAKKVKESTKKAPAKGGKKPAAKAKDDAKPAAKKAAPKSEATAKDAGSEVKAEKKSASVKAAAKKTEAPTPETTGEQEASS